MANFINTIIGHSTKKITNTSTPVSELTPNCQGSWPCTSPVRILANVGESALSGVNVGLTEVHAARGQ
jgi:hypothetical protein